MRWSVALVVVAAACEPPSAPAAAPPAAVGSATSAAADGDACQSDIPDCEAACAMREAHRTTHIDWFDRRCAAVVLGKNPDKAVEPPTVDGGRPNCDPPFRLTEDGIKRWKRECL